MCVYIHVYNYVCVYGYVCMYVCIHVCICVYACVCMYLYMCIYTAFSFGRIKSLNLWTITIDETILIFGEFNFSTAASL